MSILIGHKFGLNDVKILTGRKVVLSYDKDAVLKVWDLDTAECVQTLPLHFPRLIGLSFEVFSLILKVALQLQNSGQGNCVWKASLVH